ncbi:MAG: DUF4443 domain-containing protein [Ignisphaera sp.]|nr:hypothetical protein [Ignisphaera sp.]MDW8085001.1 DUF4443 domain-containing protein [Ignisphaera sp.]
MLANELLESIAAPRRGVKPSFEPYHVLKALMILKEREPLGRHILSKQLSLGISSTRTLMRRLKLHGLIKIDPIGGCILTSKGKLLADNIASIIKRIHNISNLVEGSLKLAKYAYAALLSNYKDGIISMGISNVRDILISNGAKAALIIFIDEHHVFLPPDDKLNEKAYPILATIASYMRASYSDVILISYSDNVVVAESSLYSGLISIVLQNITI